MPQADEHAVSDSDKACPVWLGLSSEAEGQGGDVFGYRSEDPIRGIATEKDPVRKEGDPMLCCLFGLVAPPYRSKQMGHRRVAMCWQKEVVDSRLVPATIPVLVLGGGEKGGEMDNAGGIPPWIGMEMEGPRQKPKSNL